jgi:hypothetical protein
MPKEIISTPEAPQSPMYSQAVKAGNTIYAAGTRAPSVDCHGSRHRLSRPYAAIEPDGRPTPRIRR